MVRIVDSIEDANCITHNGTMHADEVFATAFLDLYLGNVSVLRTSSVNWDIVPDGILVYDVGRREFDHHQLDALKRESSIPYSSIGLLWRKFGKDFLIKNNYENVEQMFIELDKDLIEAIDADDNGVFPKIEANYKVKTLSNVIKLFNPAYASSQNESDQFIKAVNFAKKIFEEELLYIQGKVIAGNKINKLLENNSIDNKYLILDEFVPFEEALINNPLGDNILFVAFPSNRGGYAIKTLPKNNEDKTARMEFPLEWGGLSDKELEEASGIDGLRFCHKGRFIVSCSNIDAVYKVFDVLCK